MKNVLDVCCLPRGERSRTRRLRTAFFDALRERFPEVCIETLDVVRDVDSLARIDAWDVEAKFEIAYGEGRLDTIMAERWEAISALTDQLHAADLVVVSAPMWNFSVPWQLKRWIDSVVQAKLTFEFVDGNYRGLLGGRRGVILTTRDGRYLAPDGWTAGDFQLPYLRHILGFMGVSEIHEVVAEPMLATPEDREAAVEQAARAAGLLARALP